MRVDMSVRILGKINLLFGFFIINICDIEKNLRYKKQLCLN